MEKTPAYTSPQTLQTLQTPLPTFPISATTLIIFGFLFINLFYKKIFSIFGKNTSLYKPPNASNASNASSNFSNFRNYPNYFRFPIYKFILQKKIFSIFGKNFTRFKRFKRLFQLFQFPQLP